MRSFRVPSRRTRDRPRPGRILPDGTDDRQGELRRRQAGHSHRDEDEGLLVHRKLVRSSVDGGLREIFIAPVYKLCSVPTARCTVVFRSQFVLCIIVIWKNCSVRR